MQSSCEPLEDFMTSIRFFDRRAIAAAALFLAACGNEVAHETARTVTAPVQVVETTAIPDTRITTGTVRAMTVSPLAAKVMGNVTRVLVSEGQRVHAGELLLEIDDREGRARTQQATAGGGEVDQAISGATAGVAAAEANATLANATYKRFAALRERGSVSPQEFEEVTARKQGADAQLEQARRGRVRTALYRPGFVGRSDHAARSGGADPALGRRGSAAQCGARAQRARYRALGDRTADRQPAQRRYSGRRAGHRAGNGAKARIGSDFVHHFGCA